MRETCLSLLTSFVCLSEPLALSTPSLLVILILCFRSTKLILFKKRNCGGLLTELFFSPKVVTFEIEMCFVKICFFIVKFVSKLPQKLVYYFYNIFVYYFLTSVENNNKMALARFERLLLLRKPFHHLLLSLLCL